MSVQNLEKRGYYVEVTHYRYVPVYDPKSLSVFFELVNASTTAKHRRKDFYCKGGLTVVMLFRHEAVVAMGQSKCSIEDNFNRKFGVQRACEDAVRMLESTKALDKALEDYENYVTADNLVQV